jgi:hypothetical protein
VALARGVTSSDNTSGIGTLVMALPAGAAAGDPAFAFGQNAASTSITMTATGWTQLIGAAANNMYVVGCWKVLDSTDIATGSISFTVTSRSHPFQLVVFDGTQVSGIDASASLPLSSSAYGTRGGVTQATTPAPFGHSLGVIEGHPVCFRAQYSNRYDH